MSKKAVKKQMPVAFTETQKAWLMGKSEVTGETMAAVVRALVQSEINKEAK